MIGAPDVPADKLLVKMLKYASCEHDLFFADDRRIQVGRPGEGGAGVACRGR